MGLAFSGRRAVRSLQLYWAMLTLRHFVDSETFSHRFGLLRSFAQAFAQASRIHIELRANLMKLCVTKMLLVFVFLYVDVSILRMYFNTGIIR